MNDLLTYRHPRTLNEAFPGGVDYAYAIERGDRYANFGRALGGALAIMLLMLLAAWLWRSVQAEPIETATLVDARTQAQHQARFDRAAHAMCAGRVAWIDTTLGVVKCGKKLAP